MVHISWCLVKNHRKFPILFYSHISDGFSCPIAFQFPSIVPNLSSSAIQRWRWRSGSKPRNHRRRPQIRLESQVFFFPTCQVRVVRFYVNSRASSFSSFSFSASPPPPRTSTTTSHAQCSLPDLNHDQPRPVFAAGPQPRPSMPSVRCRTSTTTIHAQCSLPDLNHDHPRPVFAAGPQPRPSTPSVRCRTSITTSHAQCSLPDLNHDHQCPVLAAGPQVLCQKLCQIESQKICQIECQKICQIECQKI